MTYIFFFLNNKKLNFIINSYLNFDWTVYGCITWYNPTSNEEHYVHRIHRDYDDYKSLGINIYWNKVDENNGALSYVKRSHNVETPTDKKDLLIGEILDGEGGFASRGKLVTSKNSVDNNFLPLGLSEGAKTKRSIKKNEIINIDDVEINWNQEVLKAREYQINILN